MRPCRESIAIGSPSTAVEEVLREGFGVARSARGGEPEHPARSIGASKAKRILFTSPCTLHRPMGFRDSGLTCRVRRSIIASRRAQRRSATDRRMTQRRRVRLVAEVTATAAKASVGRPKIEKSATRASRPSLPASR